MEPIVKYITIENGVIYKCETRTVVEKMIPNLTALHIGVAENTKKRSRDRPDDYPSAPTTISDVDSDTITQLIGRAIELCRGHVSFGYIFEELNTGSNLLWILKRRNEIIGFAVCEASWEGGWVRMGLICTERGYGNALFKQVLTYVIKEGVYFKFETEPVNGEVAAIYQTATMELTGQSMREVELSDGSGIRQILDILNIDQSVRDSIRDNFLRGETTRVASPVDAK